jgi:hypothetical protein
MAFMTVERDVIVRRFAQIVGREGEKVDRGFSGDVDRALQMQGLIAHPAVANTRKNDYIRIVRTGTRFSGLQDLIMHPSPAGDEDLGNLLSLVKAGLTVRNETQDPRERIQ